MKRPQASRGVYVASLLLGVMALVSSKAWAQSAGTPPNATMQSAQSQSAPQAAPNDDLAQMRTDLDRMESLLGNMSSEIEFLHDQNLQILLRTNAQIWTTLIRDLRRQVDREEKQRSYYGIHPAGDSAAPKAKPHEN